MTITTEEQAPGYNERLKADRLRRELGKRMAWVNTVSAQAEQKRRAVNAELEAMGFEPVESAIVTHDELSERELAKAAAAVEA